MPQLEHVDCFSEGQAVLQDAAIVNFILQKLATLINGWSAGADIGVATVVTVAVTLL